MTDTREALDSTPRGQFMAQLEPKLPKTWKLVKHERNLDEIAQITVLVRQRSVARMKEAPQGWFLTESVLELIVPQTDPVTAEDTLDLALFQLLGILDAINPTIWKDTLKVLDAGTKRMAYDVTVQFPTEKDH